MTEVWTKWENRVINGIFPLRRFLGKSTHSVVFLTEYAAQNFPNAAIKLVPADPAQTETQLAYWRSAAALSHPHLIRILDVGRCRLGGHPFLFLVMEYAEETLAQILPQRPLTPDEVREMLRPTLAALDYLHSKNLVHGQLKPANILVIGDQVKLASDNIHPAGKARPMIARPSPYDPPEAKIRGLSAPGDVWGLGNIMTEALTQHRPEWLDERSEAPTLPASLPAEFADVVRRCLSRNSADRPTLAGLEARLDPAPSTPEVLVLEPSPSGPAQTPAPTPASAPAPAVLPALAPAAIEAPAAAAAPQPPVTPKTPEPIPMEWAAALNAAAAERPPADHRAKLWAVVATLIVGVLAWAGLHHQHSDAPPSASSAAASAAQPAAPLAAAPTNPNPPLSAEAPPRPVTPQNPADTSGSVVHEEIPNVSRGSRASIRGTIKVTVRVTVDRSGKVVEEAVEYGTSKYFARVSRQAARKWRFAAADHPQFRAWLLQFDFSRTGTTGQATPSS
jgi:hypothetical protein